MVMQVVTIASMGIFHSKSLAMGQFFFSKTGQVPSNGGREVWGENAAGQDGSCHVVAAILDFAQQQRVFTLATGLCSILSGH